ncbi:MAG: CSLREA domain-containing protein [Chloroflexi bacterium]|nr:CSLREA domain-containing protein [Chloroflexota bacterium]
MCKRTFNKNICSLSMLRVMLLVALIVAVWVLVPTGLALADGITVDTTVDQSGTGTECSLREAIRAASINAPYGGCVPTAAPGPDTITFNAGLSGGTIVLGSQLVVSSTMEINGNVPITVSGNSTVRVFAIDAGGAVTMTHLSIANGNTALDGGGILVQTGAAAFVNGCLLRNNTAGLNGGGIQNNGGVLTVVNSTFVQNQATTNGGGGINNANGGLLRLGNSTFLGNGANFGGALNNVSVMDFANNILANSPSGGDCVNLATINSNVNNLIETNGGGLPPCGVAALGTNPLLAPLGDYGGQTWTHALLPGSPAIDAGSNVLCPPTDQRGEGRPVHGTCDIGAFESQGFYFDNLGGDGQSTLLNTTFGEPLTLTVVATNTVEPVGADGIITFSAPLAGAGITTGTFTTTTSLAGGVSVLVHANGTLGSYVVTATTRGASTPALFDLTNSCDVTVVNTDDSGAGSLRQAISDACAGGQIDFSLTLPATITLTSGELSIDKNLAIQGPGRDLLTVSGNDASRVFNIGASGVVTITGLMVRDGSATTGGGIYSSGNLHLEDAHVFDNSATMHGGGVYVWSGSTTLIGTQVVSNSTSENGGGVFVGSGSATMTGMQVVSNSASSGGGLCISSGGEVSISGTTFYSNTTSSSSNSHFDFCSATQRHFWLFNEQFFQESGGIFPLENEIRPFSPSYGE